MNFAILSIVILASSMTWAFAATTPNTMNVTGTMRSTTSGAPRGTTKAATTCRVDGIVIPHGASATFYNVDSVTGGDTCSGHSISRLCQHGILQGSSSHSFGTCSAITCSAANVLKSACATEPVASLFQTLSADPAGGWLEPSNKALPATYTVASAAALTALVPSLVPGDIVAISPGTWSGNTVVITATGTAVAPITIRATTQSGVVLTAGSSVRLRGSFLRLEGLKFTGVAPSNAISIGDSSVACTHCTVSEITFDSYNPVSLATSTRYIQIVGQWNRVTRSTFLSKRSYGNTIGTYGSPSYRSGEYHLIDNNFFDDRPDGFALTGISNGFETIATYSDPNGIQTELYSAYWGPLYTFIRNNYFKNQDGEAELITIKGSNVTIFGNTFEDSAGAVTLRTSNNSVIEGNVFAAAAGSTDASGGVRVHGKNHAVVHNIFQDLNAKTSDYLIPVTLWRGDSKPTTAAGEQYMPVTGGLFAFNIFANNTKSISIGNGFYGTANVVPKLSNLAHNVVQAGPQTLSGAISAFTPLRIAPDANLINGLSTSVPGFTVSASALAVYSPTLRIYMPTAAAAVTATSDRAVYQQVLQRLPLAAVDKSTMLSRLWYINTDPTSAIVWRRYDASDVGVDVGARAY